MDLKSSSESIDEDAHYNGLSTNNSAEREKDKEKAMMRLGRGRVKMEGEKGRDRVLGREGEGREDRMERSGIATMIIGCHPDMRCHR